MSLFGTTKVEEGAKCPNCKRGVYKKHKVHHEKMGLGKALFTGFMTGATKQSASELGLAKTTYRCTSCGHEVTI